MSDFRQIYYRGKIQEVEHCQLSVMDHGPRYGCGAFDTFRYRGQGIPDWGDRYRRMEAALSWLDIRGNLLSLWRQTSPDNSVALEQILQSLLAANGVREAIVRYTLFPGASRSGLADLGYENPVEMIDLRSPTTVGSRRDLCLLEETRAWERPPFKSTSSYLVTLRGLRELRRYALPEVGEGLLLTRDGWLTEGLFSNLFAVDKDQTLWTPLDNGYLLAGVTRKRVLDAAHTQGVRTRISVEKPDYLANAVAIFTTNSGSGLSPATRIFKTSGEVLWEGDTSGNEIWQALQSCQL